jgi:hypothetical protein
VTKRKEALKRRCQFPEPRLTSENNSRDVTTTYDVISSPTTDLKPSPDDPSVRKKVPATSKTDATKSSKRAADPFPGMEDDQFRRRDPPSKSSSAAFYGETDLTTTASRTAAAATTAARASTRSAELAAASRDPARTAAATIAAATTATKRCQCFKTVFFIANDKSK